MDLNNECIKILREWIVEYCNSRNYNILEIDYERKCVFYYLDGDNIFEDYKDFNYLEVDLFN